MFTAKEMFGVTVKGALEKRVQTIDFNGADADGVVEKTNAVIGESRLMADVPDYLSVITLHYDTDGTSVDSVKLTLKTRVRDAINDDNLKISTIIPYNDSYKETLVNFVARWVDSYFVAFKAQSNAEALNEVIAPLCGEIKVSFAYSDLVIVSMTNDSVVLGLSAEALAYATELDIFSSIAYVSSKAREVLGASLQTLTTPYEVLTTKNRILKQLGVYTRVGVSKLLKKTYKKNISTAAAALEALNAKRAKEFPNTDPIVESPVSRFEYTDEAGSFFGLVKCIKSEAVKEGTPVALDKDGYSYVIILSPFDKKMQVLSDEDTAVLLESQIA